jgi:hypothetical protein
MGARIKAFFVIGAICAMTIGLILPTFSLGTPFARGGAAECPHHIAKQDSSFASRDGAPWHAPRHSGLPGCPHCCLAAHLGTAVLPLRSSSLARPERCVASHMRYAVYSASAIKPVAVQSANGARAPPAA